VCAYANNQHELGTDIGADPRQSSFSKAMELSKGMLLILDDAATPFCRIWCLFEGSMYADQGMALYLDIATVHHSEPYVITEGLLKEETRLEAVMPGWGVRDKHRREQGFPLELLEHGYVIDVTQGQASRDEDRVHILNSIAGLPVEMLDNAVAASHPSYGSVNGVLRSTYAEAALPITSGGGDTALTHLWPAMAADAGRMTLVVDLLGSPITNVGVLQFAEVVLRKLMGLRHLTLIFEGCNCVSDVSALGVSLGNLTQLGHLHMGFTGCTALSDVSALGVSLGNLTQLRHLHMGFTGCTALSDVSALGVSLGNLTQLGHLHMGFAGCTALSDGSALLVSLGNLTQLGHLHMPFDACTALSDVSALGVSLGNLTQMRHLHMGFTGCTALSDVSALGVSLCHLTQLQHLFMGFTGCTALSDVSALEVSLVYLTQLQRCQMQL